MAEVKTFFIPSCCKPIIKTKEVQVPTGKKERGFFGGEKDVMRIEQQQEIVGYSNSAIDGFTLAEDMHKTIDPWLTQGYELFSITPITSGGYDYEYTQGVVKGSIISGSGSISGTGTVGYSYGYSYTEGIMVVLKKA